MQSKREILLLHRFSCYWVALGISLSESLFSPLLYRLSYLPISKNSTTYATASIGFPPLGKGHALDFGFVEVFFQCITVLEPCRLPSQPGSLLGKPDEELSETDEPRIDGEANYRRFVRDHEDLHNWLRDHPDAAKAIQANPDKFLWRSRTTNAQDFLRQLFGR